MLFSMFGGFITHHMRDAVPEAEEQGGVCPLEEAVGDGDVRMGGASGFQKVRLVWDADTLSANS